MNLSDEKKNAIWDEIDSCLNSTPERQPGDIDANQMVEHLKELGGACSSDYARKKMINMAATGKWKYIDVYDPAIKNIRKVIRPVTTK